jgi:glucokinase
MNAYARPALVPADVACGVDIGGSRWRSLMTNGKLKSGSTSASSLEALLDHVFSLEGIRPTAAVLCLEGTATPNGHKFTKLPWPPVVIEELKSNLGLAFLEIINDMQGAALGLGAIRRESLTRIKPGREASAGRHHAVLTLSTGLNWTTIRPGDATLPLAREQGHVRLGLPVDDTTIMELVEFVSSTLNAPASIEDLLSGARGVDLIAQFLLGSASAPGEDVRAAMAANRKARKDNAPMMSAGALGGDSFWAEVAKLYGRVLGYLINQIVVGELVGKLFIQGSVLNGTPGFARWLVANTALLETAASVGMEKSWIAEAVEIYCVPNEVNLAVIGAEQRARSARS